MKVARRGLGKRKSGARCRFSVVGVESARPLERKPVKLEAEGSSPFTPAMTQVSAAARIWADESVFIAFFFLPPIGSLAKGPRSAADLFAKISRD